MRSTLYFPQILLQFLHLCAFFILYDNNFRIDYRSSLLRNTLYFCLQNKVLALSLIRHPECHIIKSTSTSVLIRTLCLSKSKPSSLGLLITFMHNFQLNLVVMFEYFVNRSLVINLIYTKKLIFYNIIQLYSFKLQSKL
jgi:hypothetical protein